MLALEHKASVTRADVGDQISLGAQPFGGAIRILNARRLISLIGSFNFDSQKSRSERDFRVYIHPSSWVVLRDFCLQDMIGATGTDLEIDPTRELVEEFEDALGVQLKPDQYALQPFGIVVENEPVPSANLRAEGIPTARIYRVFEVRILDRSLGQMMLANSQAHPGHVLRTQALEDARRGGQGRANAVLVAAEEEIRAALLNVPPEQRGLPLPFASTLLEGNVAAIFKDICVPRYVQPGRYI